MTSVYELKPRFQQRLRPTVRRLAAAGITANQVTLAALALSTAGATAVCFLSNWPLAFTLLPVIWLLRMGLNAIDGMLAREHQMQSPLGCFLNELCDVIADVALFIPFAFIPVISLPILACTLFLFLLAEIAGLIAPQIGSPRRYDGPLGKSDRALAASVYCVALAFIPSAPSALNGFLLVLTLLSLVTVCKRTSRAIAEVFNV